MLPGIIGNKSFKKIALYFAAKTIMKHFVGKKVEKI